MRNKKAFLYEVCGAAHNILFIWLSLASVRYKRFYEVVDREWSRVFVDLKGETLPLALPTATVPSEVLGDFTLCRPDTLSKN